MSVSVATQSRVPELITAVNGDLIALQQGMVVAMLGGTLVRALATSYVLSFVIGVVLGPNLVTLPVTAVTFGQLELPTAVWDLVTGDVGGLVPDAPYFLSSTLGMMSTAAPIAGSVTQVGIAASSTVLVIDPSRPILL